MLLPLKLSSHPDSAKVLDYLFASVKARDQNSLLQEFYSPEFVVFANDDTTKDKSLGELLALKPEKKSQILENLRKVSPNTQSRTATLLLACFLFFFFSPCFSFFIALIFVLLGRLASV